MTKLEALNLALMKVGLRRVNALETGTASTVADLEFMIDQRTNLVLAEGWHFNNRRNVTLNPDAGGHILMNTIGEVVSNGIISAISATATPVVTTNSGHGLTTSSIVTIAGSDATIGAATSGNISAVSAANPTQVTATAHGLNTGDTVVIAGTSTSPSVNGTFVVTVLDADHFTIPVNVLSAPVGTGTFTSVVKNVSGPYALSAVGTNTFTIAAGQITVTLIGTTGTYTAVTPLTVSEIRSDGNDRWRNIAMHSDRLYDLDNNTDVFGGQIVVRYVLQPTFDLLPPKVQAYVAAEAAVAFNDSYGQPQRAAALRLDAARLRAQARNSDSRIADANVLNGSNVQDTRGWRQPYPQDTTEIGGMFTGWSLGQPS